MVGFEFRVVHHATTMLKQNNFYIQFIDLIRSSNAAFGAILVLAILALSTPLFIQSRVEAQDKRVVSIYVDGVTKRLATDATTVGDALDRAGVALGDHDLAEPTVEVPISQDSFNINVYRARPVTVYDGPNKHHILTAYQSPQLIARDAGLETFPEDNFYFERVDDFLAEQTVGLKMIIDRATPMKIDLYGSKLTTRTHAETVGEVLSENNIEVRDSDKIKPAVDKPVKKGMTIKVINVGTKVVAEEETIPFGTDIINDTSLPMGTSKVNTAGQNGVRLTTYEVVYHNGKEVSRKKVQTIVKQQPTNEVRVVGSQVPDGNSNAQIGRQMAANRGWKGAEWGCLYQLWDHESHWNHLAANPSSGAYGIPQALPGSKMGSVGSDWATNPATQIQWGLDYIAGRYGTPCGAYNFFQANNWY
ncbi:MAG: G5 domain-containing protein [Candidatus Saccharimonadales bacterium]|nr:G5 domain-containing protein [Candidatus Saccharimonadales bacterium]